MVETALAGKLVVEVCIRLAKFRRVSLERWMIPSSQRGGGVAGRGGVQQLGIAGPLILPRRCCASPNGITPPRVIARERADIRVTMGARQFEVT